MTVQLALGVGLVGGLGAVARFVLDGALARRVAGTFPYGTLAVNLIGAFVLGALVGAAVGGSSYRLWGTGLIGAFTTFSTWMLEAHRLGEDGALRLGTMNLAVGLVLGVLAAWAGRHVGALL